MTKRLNVKSRAPKSVFKMPKEKAEKLKQMFESTISFDERMGIVDLAGELGEDGFDVLAEMYQATISSTMKQKIREKMREILKK